MSGGLMSGGRMSGGQLSGGLKSYDHIRSFNVDNKPVGHTGMNTPGLAEV